MDRRGLELFQELGGIRSLVQIDQQSDALRQQLGPGLVGDARVNTSAELVR
jgi:hypothetical protein